MDPVLELVFLNAEGKKRILTIKAPKEDLTQTQAFAAMDAIIAANVFSAGYTEKVEARMRSNVVVPLVG